MYRCRTILSSCLFLSPKIVFSSSFPVDQAMPGDLLVEPDLVSAYIGVIMK